MKYNPLIIAIALLGSVWGLYFSHFNNGLSSDQGVWGTFGDFTGGVLNPFLNFITIYLLIKSLNSQEQALVHSRTQYKDALNDLDRKRDYDALRAFEVSFFNFSDMAMQNYSRFKLKFGNTEFHGAEALENVMHHILEAKNNNKNLEEVFNDIDDSNHNEIYSLVKSFAVLYKLTVDMCPEAHRKRYAGMITTLLPTQVIYLLCISEACTAWPILKYPRDMNFFKDVAVKQVIDNFLN